MKQLIVYLLEVLACSGVLLAAYRLLLEQRTHFSWCRIYLLATPLVAALIPLLDIPVWPGEVIAAEQPLPEIAVVGFAPAAQPAIATTTTTATTLAPEWLAAIAYAAGILAIGVWMALQLLHIRRLRRDAEIRQTQRYRIVHTRSKIASFSFLRSIYVWKQTPDEEMRAILTHEASHIAHGHSVERIVMECMKALLWWNPFVWLAERRLVEVEEFEADSDVLSNGYDLSAYMQTIFKQLFGYSPAISNGLRDSLTKKRFKMMTSSRSGRYSLLRLSATIPVVMGLLCAFSFSTRAAVVTPAAAAEEQPGKVYFRAAYLLNGKEVAADVVRGIEVQGQRGLSGQEIPEELHDRNLDFVFSFTTDGEPQKIQLINIEGRVLNFDGTPAADVSVYAGHNCTVPTNDAETERLCVKTDTEGRYRTKGPKKGAIYYKSSDGCAGMHSYNSDGISPYTVEDSELLRPSAQVKEPAETTPDGSQAAKHVDIVPPSKVNAAESSAEELDDDTPFLISETMPTFQGGDLNVFRSWVQSRVKFPETALANHISGRVVLAFVIEKDGSVSNIDILQTPDKSLSEEALRVVGSSPKWTPGSQYGHIVRVKYTLPIDFKLAEVTPTPAPETEKATPFLISETMPSFQGSDLIGFRDWVQAQVEYPESLRGSGIYGRVTVTFVIETDGSVSEIKLMQAPDNAEALFDEVARVIGSSPKWTPGNQHGKVVRVRFTLPVDFKKQKNTKK